MSSPLVNFIRRKFIKNQLPQMSQVSSGNSINIQGTGNISVGTLITQNDKIPTTLAKPFFVIEQVGFRGSTGITPEYTLKILNMGGTCFNVNIYHNRSNEEYRFSHFPRGSSRKIQTSFWDTAGPFLIIIDGLDENGNEHRQLIHGINHIRGYKFS